MIPLPALTFVRLYPVPDGPLYALDYNGRIWIKGIGAHPDAILDEDYWELYNLPLVIDGKVVEQEK